MFAIGFSEKTFDFPLGTEVFFQEGDTVSAGNILYRAAKKEAPTLIFAAAFFDIDPAALARLMKVACGEFVIRDQILAQKGTLPLIRRILRAPITGIIEEIDLERGIIIIRLQPKRRDYYLPVTGVIKNVTATTLTVQSQGLSIIGAYGEGPPTFGQFLWSDESNTESSDQNRPVIFGIKKWNRETEALVRNIQQKNKIGLIAAAIPAHWIEKNNGDIPYVVTEGLGDVAMSVLMEGVLSQCVSKVVTIFPETKVYAGATRPRILCSDVSEMAVVVPHRSARLLRAPYVGVYGTVEKTDDGVTFKSEQGEAIKAPFQNIEIF